MDQASNGQRVRLKGDSRTGVVMKQKRALDSAGKKETTNCTVRFPGADGDQVDEVHDVATLEDASEAAADEVAEDPKPAAKSKKAKK